MFVGCDSKDYFYLDCYTCRQRVTTKNKSRVSLSFKDMVEPFRRAVCDCGMLLKIRGTGHMDPEPNYSDQTIKTDCIAGCGKSVARSEEGRLAALFDS